MKRKARLKDIAEALNISTTTVSRALNNKDDISHETKKAVLDVAKMLNYRANYFAKSLHQDDNHLIGVIVPRVNHSFYSQMIDGILHNAKHNGYTVLLAESMDENGVEKQCIDQFLNINVGSLIIAPAHNSDLMKGHAIIGIDKRNVVICDRSSEKSIYNQITNNHLEGAYQATEQLIKRGCQRIGHIRGLEQDNIADAIYNGYLNAISDNNLSEHVYQCNKVRPEDSYQASVHLIEQYKVQAIIAVSDEAALGVYRYCYEHDISIPDELAIIGFSNAQFTQYMTPALSTVDQKSREMGLKTIDLLISQKSEHFRKVLISLNTNFIQRESS